MSDHIYASTTNTDRIINVTNMVTIAAQVKGDDTLTFYVRGRLDGSNWHTLTCVNGDINHQVDSAPCLYKVTPYDEVQVVLSGSGSGTATLYYKALANH